MNLSELGEFGLIRRFSKSTPSHQNVIVGIGDDAAAVVVPREEKLLLLTCDPVIEGIHFDSTAKPFQIGWKAMARNLSDIAAMGGKPLYALVSAALPSSTSVSKAQEIYRGLSTLAKKYQVAIVGGDTSHTKRGIHITVTVVGEIDRSKMILRSGARIGDILCVTGTLGGSLSSGKHLHFEPRVAEAQFLCNFFRPSAMMDLSDGLASDLHRLAEKSHVGFEIWSDRLPLSNALKGKKSPFKKLMTHALKDGEDYELLFTISAQRLPSLQKAWRKKFRLKLTPIGRVQSQKAGIQLINRLTKKSTGEFPLTENDHFKTTKSSGC